MKRGSSSNTEDDEIPFSPALSQSGSEDFKPDITPPAASKSKTKKNKTVPKTPAPRKKVKKESSDDSGSSSGGGGSNGEWTPEKKGVLIDRVIAAGYKVLDIGGLAKELELTPVQIKNHLNVGRKGNLRDKAVQAARI